MEELDLLSQVLYVDLRQLVACGECFMSSPPLQSGPKCPGGQHSLSSSMHSHSNRSGASCCLQSTYNMSVQSSDRCMVINAER